MSTNKHIDRICLLITAISLILTLLFINGQALGLTVADRVMGYEKTLFDTSRVHTIDIIIDDWDTFIDSAAGEEYTACSVVIDNEAVKNVAIRGKGNTSLSTVQTLGSERYSLKIEFDHYEDGKTYKGLDKLCLNNSIQDNTYMKDYLAYTLMAEAGADAPLCSYVWVTVNGEDWGLYLAVEAVEDSFLNRVYSGQGDLYKPDSLSMGGGGPGNGKEFDMSEFMEGMFGDGSSGKEQDTDSSNPFSGAPGGTSLSYVTSGSDTYSIDLASGDDTKSPPQGDRPSSGRPDGDSSGGFGGFGGGGFGGFGGGFGMGSSDVKLQYTDDSTESYSNIFDNAKTDVSDSDKSRLISSLRTLQSGEDLEDVLDIDEVLRYFVVHNFLVNNDSYTGMMVHNYYLHEYNGKLSMIPWDYNLAFGTFQSGNSSESVNDPIDTPLSVSGDGSRPMADWIFENEEYTELYHQYMAEFLDSTDILAIIDETYDLIAEYVEKDPTAFCTYEEFEKGVETMRSFCELRIESIRGQLDGTIPSTDAGQQADSSSLIDSSGINLSDMGSMGSSGNNSPGSFSFGGGDQNFDFPGSSSGGDGGFPGFDPESDDGSSGLPGFDPGSGDGSSGFPGFDPGSGNGGNGSFPSFNPGSGDGSSGFPGFDPGSEGENGSFPSFNPGSGDGGSGFPGFDPGSGDGSSGFPGFDPGSGNGDNGFPGFDPGSGDGSSGFPGFDQGGEGSGSFPSFNPGSDGGNSDSSSFNPGSGDGNSSFPGSDQNSEGASGEFPSFDPGNNPGGGPSSQGGNSFSPNKSGNAASLVLTGISIAVLIAGLLTVILYKKKH